MEVHWTCHIPQAMQRHTGCAWVRPTAAEPKATDSKSETRGPKEPLAEIEVEKKAA